MKTCYSHKEVFVQILTIRVGIYLLKFMRRQAHAIQTVCSNLKGFRATIQIQVDNEDKQIKLTAIWQILKFFAKYFLAWQFSMSSRQCSSNKLMTLQIWSFFSSYTVSWNLLLIVNCIVYWLFPRNVKETSNNGSKLFQKFLFL